MNSFFEHLDRELDGNHSSKRGSNPKCFVVETTCIETEDYSNVFPDFRLEFLEVVCKVVASTFFICFQHYYGSWMWDFMFLAHLDSGNCSKTSIAIVIGTSTIQSVSNQFGFCWMNSLRNLPAITIRLFVHVAVYQNRLSVVEITWNISK